MLVGWQPAETCLPFRFKYFSLDFPRTADQRVYHLGLRPGEVANRIVSGNHNLH